MKRIRVNHYTKEIVGNLQLSVPVSLFEQMKCLYNHYDPHVITQLALETFFNYRFAVYVIWSPSLRVYSVGAFEWADVTDVPCHLLYSYGENSLGEIIRLHGIKHFKFKVLGRFKDEDFVKRLMFSCHRKLTKRGYERKVGLSVVD